jgi:hypothetical protein
VLQRARQTHASSHQFRPTRSCACAHVAFSNAPHETATPCDTAAANVDAAGRDGERGRGVPCVCSRYNTDGFTDTLLHRSRTHHDA